VNVRVDQSWHNETTQHVTDDIACLRVDCRRDFGDTTFTNRDVVAAIYPVARVD
jgi:hypothetical protein